MWRTIPQTQAISKRMPLTGCPDKRTSGLLVWVLPVFLYLRYIDHIDPLEYLKLKQNRKKSLLIGLVLSILIFFGSLLRYGVPHPGRRLFTWNSFLSTSVLIGFIE